ncbi:MAG: aminotransferase class I/II-fold pyridoxal phosphate-dependent enzyme [Elusimicrobia bacterium]|nr:aminotransferase class I/II-fold pyridoxal phosphate-dependent enzyme [Elusimicrobiota bacterium]
MKEPPLNPRLADLPPYLFVALDRKREAAVRRGRDIINLGIGDPDLPTPGFIVDAMAEAVRDPSLHRYPDNRGSEAFREAVAWFMRERYGVRLDPATEVLALIGSKEGIGHLPLALAGRGCAVYAPDPGYPPYWTGALLAGARPVRYPLLEGNGFLPDFGSRPLAGARGARLLFLNYPNNPTGATASPGLFSRAVAWALERGAWLAHDAAYAEAFFDGARPPSVLAAPGAMRCAVEFHSLSKTFNMTGWRVGWACGSSRAIRALAEVKSNIDSGVFTAVQAAAVAALRRGDAAAQAMRERLGGRRARCAAALERAGWRVFPGAATFYLWCATPGGIPSARCAERLLERAGVMATPGAGFGPRGEGYVRFALTAVESRLSLAMERIAAVRW